jgi:hypothetical protein
MTHQDAQQIVDALHVIIFVMVMFGIVGMFLWFAGH